MAIEFDPWLFCPAINPIEIALAAWPVCPVPYPIATELSPWLYWPAA